MKPEVSVQQGDDFMRYEIGDFVSKPVTGVCRIEDILYLDAQGKKDNKLYYRMHPVEDEKETIYVPVSNSDSALRPCLTEENAWKLIEKIPEISTPWTENEKMREQKYKEAIKANDPKALVVNIPKNLTSSELSNGYKIRRAAIDLNVPLITNSRLASAFIYAFCTTKLEDIDIKAWGEYK